MNDSMPVQATCGQRELAREAGRGPTRRAASPIPVGVAAHAGEAPAEHGAEAARREGVAATAARRLAGNGDRPATAGDRGKMADTMNHGAINHGAVHRSTINRSVKAGVHQ